MAHPRVGGENLPGDEVEELREGSSPRRRGKPRADENIRLGYGLIPA